MKFSSLKEEFDKQFADKMDYLTDNYDQDSIVFGWALAKDLSLEQAVQFVGYIYHPIHDQEVNTKYFEDANLDVVFFLEFEGEDKDSFSFFLGESDDGEDITDFTEMNPTIEDILNKVFAESVTTVPEFEGVNLIPYSQEGAHTLEGIKTKRLAYKVWEALRKGLQAAGAHYAPRK